MNDPYCYENSEVLKNKLGIKEGIVLEKAEVDFSCNAIHELSVSPLVGNYDFKHFCDFHDYIFKDLYDWAGNPRTVEMEKAEAVLGYMSIEYAKPGDIKKVASEIIEEMNNREWSKMSLEEQAINLSNDIADLWKVHSFREGNTRTIITFICQFADDKGMLLDRGLFEKNPAYTRNALVAATAIFKDGDFRKPEYLYKIVEDSLKLGLENNKQNEQKMSMKDRKLQVSQMRADKHFSKKDLHTKKKNDRNER